MPNSDGLVMPTPQHVNVEPYMSDLNFPANIIDRSRDIDWTRSL